MMFNPKRLEKMMSSPTTNSDGHSDICKRCGGKCCRWTVTETLDPSPYKAEFWETTGAILHTKTDHSEIWMMPNVCQHSEENGKCDIYGTGKRPQLCRDFPESNLPRLWRLMCPLFKVKHNKKDGPLKVFKTTER